MAGPDSDVGKLTPVMENYYELVRFGTDVFPMLVRCKESARKLFTSDIPLVNPDLIDDTEAGLKKQKAEAGK
jgi:hypothetical protein